MDIGYLDVSMVLTAKEYISILWREAVLTWILWVVATLCFCIMSSFAMSFIERVIIARKGNK